MPPHRVHRMVQYSEPARPLMTRSTLNWPSHSGQLDRTAAGGLASEDLASEDLASESYMGGLPLRLVVRASSIEIVDPGPRIGDRGVRIGPGETDFQLAKQTAVDDDRLEIRPADPGVPAAPSGLESLDLKAVIIH